MEEQQVAVMLVEDIRLDPRELAQDIADCLKITPVEARMMMRRSRGVIMAKGSPKQARLLCQTLARRKIDTHVVPLKFLPKLPVPQKVAYFTKSEDVLLYKGADGKIEGGIAWGDVLVAVAAPVGLEAYQAAVGSVRFADMNLKAMDDTEARDLLRENMIMAVGGSQDKRDSETQRRSKERTGDLLIDVIEKKHARKVKVYVDLIPADLSIWIRANMADSTYQIEEGGVRMGAAMGMRYLLNDLRERAANARISPTLQALVEPSELSDAIISDIEELGNYTTWMSYVAWLSGRRESGGEIETVSFDDL